MQDFISIIRKSQFLELYIMKNEYYKKKKIKK